VKTRVLSH